MDGSNYYLIFKGLYLHQVFQIFLVRVYYISELSQSIYRNIPQLYLFAFSIWKFKYETKKKKKILRYVFHNLLLKEKKKTSNQIQRLKDAIGRSRMWTSDY